MPAVRKFLEDFSAHKAVWTVMHDLGEPNV
jgi:hypothetical protein